MPTHDCGYVLVHYKHFLVCNSWSHQFCLSIDSIHIWPQGGLHAPVPLGPDRVLCYNNGAGKPPRSRAQIYSVKNKTATLEMDVEVDTDYSSRDRSNVELLPDGKTLMFASTVARKCVFTDLEGKPLKVISRTGISYRSHWFPSISY